MRIRGITFCAVAGAVHSFYEVCMRDPKRIYQFCADLSDVWSNVPDWRFGQLVMNLLGDYIRDTKHDPFYAEDDELMLFFQDYFKKEGNT